MKPGFKTWLESRYRPNVVASRMSNCKRVEEHYEDLDLLYDTHRMTTLLSCLEYSTDDERHGRPNPSKIPIQGILRTGLAALRHAVCLYIKFRKGEAPRPCQMIRQIVPSDNAGSAVLDGDDLLLKVTAELGVDLPRLIAKSAIWVDPAVFHARRMQHAHAAWFPDCRRGKNGEPKRGVANGVRFDDNTMANLAIKVAVFGSRDLCTRLHVCHVWPETCYDVRYHTSLANLVLLPAPLAGLSDHHRSVAECIRYRSYQLFGWHPEEACPPMKPGGYPAASDWAPFLPIPQKIRQKFAISPA
jgi:hypothetical protein